MWQWFQCRRGKHMRSRREAWFDGERFRSKCAGCGQPMVRDGLAGWMLTSRLEEREKA